MHFDEVGRVTSGHITCRCMRNTGSHDEDPGRSIARRTAKVYWSLAVLSNLEAVGLRGVYVLYYRVGERHACKEFLKRSSRSNRYDCNSRSLVHNWSYSSKASDSPTNEFLFSVQYHNDMIGPLLPSIIYAENMSYVHKITQNPQMLEYSRWPICCGVITVFGFVVVVHFVR